MRRKKKKDLKVWDATALDDPVALNELKGFNDDQLALALVQASNVEGYAIGLMQNHADDQTISTIGLQTAWLARVVREVIALQMFERAQAAKATPDDPSEITCNHVVCPIHGTPCPAL
jgi:hypothetical protein